MDGKGEWAPKDAAPFGAARDSREGAIRHMSKTTLYMETTEISPSKTAAEVTSLLVQSGARSITTEMDGNGRITGLRFSLMIKGCPAPVPFALPVRVEPVFTILNGRRKYYDQISNAAKDRAKAERVAWRQLLRWVQAQVAMIETGMVVTEEVFMPYLIDPSGRTMFQALQESGMKMLSAGSDP